MRNLYDVAFRCLTANSIAEKIQLTQQTAQDWRDKKLSLKYINKPKLVNEPGHPVKPLLVKPSDVPKRRLGSKAGITALVHSIAHIEFNAINLAWDAIYRFRDLPEQFYTDWVHVADEESRHFQLLRGRLIELNSDYGDFPAHNGLWEMTKKTAFDPMIRMALVPRILEARGLDVTPSMIKKLRHIGEDKTVAILEVILHDEIEHVRIGSDWFNYFCQKRKLEPTQTFRDLAAQYYTGQLCGPFHYEARIKAGFSAAELNALEQLGQSTEKK